MDPSPSKYNPDYKFSINSSEARPSYAAIMAPIHNNKRQRYL